MRLCPDTNVLLRAIVQPVDCDDAEQARLARDWLRDADLVVVSLPSFCELVWVLGFVSRTPRQDITRAVRTLADARNVVCDRRAIEFGLAVAEAGGDFADGVIAETGYLAGADIFVSFDKSAVRLIGEMGRSTLVPV